VPILLELVGGCVQVEPVSNGPTYLANIHYPTFQRLPKTFYLNETAPLGTEVFKVISTCFSFKVCM
jgi:hypothetical protein